MTGGAGRPDFDPSAGADPPAFDLPSIGGDKGIMRLLTGSAATEIAWLLPAALIGFLAVLWCTRRRPRTDPMRAGLLVWGGWLLVSGLVFSYMSGVFHEYYTVALAPAAAAVAAIALPELWTRRTRLPALATLAAMAVATYGWSFYLLNRTPGWLPWLRVMLVIGTCAVAVAVPIVRLRPRLTSVIATAAVLLGLLGTTAYTLGTLPVTHSGGIVRSGPTTGNSRLGADSTANTELTELLRHAGTRWSAATPGASNAALLELSSGTSVIGIGGFMRGDPAPTLEQFQHYVAEGDVRYFVDPDVGDPDAGMFAMGGPGTANDQITAWVKSAFTPITVGKAMVYDLQQRR
ncbi:hypothetical protein [Nocardia sp. CA-119907]|uniref:hypothetical protein n=1 Tax=Nocardia sp. CA-119907 TaxID=3239973 RepID=UPI003D97104F